MNSDSNIQKTKYKSSYNKTIKILSLIVLSVFVIQDFSIAADDIFSQRFRKQKQSDKKFLPRYILQKQNNDDMVAAKNAFNNFDQLDALEGDFTDRMRRKAGIKPEDDKREGNPAGPPQAPIQFTLDDYNDETEEYETLRKYNYEGDKLASITEYDISGSELAGYFRGQVELITPDEGDPYMGSFTEGLNYEGLLDEMMNSVTVYVTEGSENNVSYILSAFDTDKPTEVTVYERDDGALKKTTAYNIEDLDIDFGELAKAISVTLEEFEDQLTDAELVDVTLYEGDKDEEKRVRSFNDFDADNLPLNLTLYYYEGEGDETKLIDSKNFDIEDISEFFDGQSNFDYSNSQLMALMLNSRMNDLGIDELLEALIANGYLDESIDKASLEALKTTAKEALTAEEFLTLLIENNLIVDSQGNALDSLDAVYALLGTDSNFIKILESLDADELFEVLLAKTLLKNQDHDRFIEEFNSALTAKGLLVENLTFDQLLNELDDANLLNTSISSARLALTTNISDYATIVKSTLIGELLADNSLLVSNYDEALNTLTTSDYLKAMSTNNVLAFLIKADVFSGDLDELKKSLVSKMLNGLFNEEDGLSKVLEFLMDTGLLDEDLTDDEINALKLQANELELFSAAQLLAFLVSKDVVVDQNGNILDDLDAAFQILAIESFDQTVDKLGIESLFNATVSLDILSSKANFSALDLLKANAFDLLNAKELLQLLVNAEALKDENGELIRSVEAALEILQLGDIIEEVIESMDKDQLYTLLAAKKLLLDENELEGLDEFKSILDQYLAQNGLTFENLSFDELLDALDKTKLLSKSLDEASFALQSGFTDVVEILTADQMLLLLGESDILNLSKDELLKLVSAKDILSVLATSKKLDFFSHVTSRSLTFDELIDALLREEVIESLDEDQIYELLLAKGLLDQNETLASFRAALDAYLADNGLNFDSLSFDELLNAFDQANLLSKSVAEATSALHSSLSSLLKLLTDAQIDLLLGKSDLSELDKILFRSLIANEDFNSITSSLSSIKTTLFQNEQNSRSLTFDELIDALLREEAIESLDEDQMYELLLAKGLLDQNETLASFRAALDAYLADNGLNFDSLSFDELLDAFD
ncbi:MAG: hypothetical protein ACI9CF_000568, partial [Candidatus Omnitrophota bacterium]